MNRMQPDMWAPGINRSQRIAEGLAGYWPFWEGDGSRVMDVQNGNLLAGTGIDANNWDSSPTGPHITLNGADEGLVTAGNFSALAGATQFTFACWIEKIGAQDTDIIVEHSGPSFSSNVGSFIVFLNAGVITVNRRISGDFNGGNHADFGVGWHHLVVSWDEVSAGNTSERMWFDSIEQTITNTFDASTVGLQVPDKRLFLGNRNTTTLWLNCNLRNVGMWRRLLLPSEIKYLYGEGEWAIVERVRHRPTAALSGGAPPAVIHNLLQGSNLGADLYNGSLL